MESDWVKIYEAGDVVKIELASQTLKNFSLEVVVMNKKDSLYGFGEYELYVKRDQVIHAKKILKDFDFK